MELVLQEEEELSHTRTHICTYIPMCRCSRLSRKSYHPLFTHVHTYMYMHMYTHMYIHTHVQVLEALQEELSPHTYTHVHTYMYIPMCRCSRLSKKSYHPLFCMAGFVGFDGDFNK